MALGLAERFQWTVFDPQSDSYVTRESLPAALRLQRAAGDTARDVLERARGEPPSLGRLFLEEMFNHSLIWFVACIAVAAAIGIWVLFALERPREDFDTYVPWMIGVGAFPLLWLKALAQAIRRHRRLRRT